jgi:hypothetical protein
MAKRGRDGVDEVQSLPLPSFSSLPDIAHDGIAPFLPDGDSKHDNRLRVSEVSRALYGSYGGALTCVFPAQERPVDWQPCCGGKGCLRQFA